MRQKFNELNLLREATRVEDNEDTETVRSRLPMPHFDQRTPELRKGICIFKFTWQLVQAPQEGIALKTLKIATFVSGQFYNQFKKKARN